MKKFVKWLLVLGLIVGGYYGFWLAYGTAVDWKPAERIEINPIGNGQVLPEDSVFSFMIWNVGFTGQGAETSFFFDDGETVILEERLVMKNLRGISNFIAEHEGIDFWMLQEVDSIAKRSHGISHLEEFNKSVPEFERGFALNFNHDFIPIPVLSPYGEARSGLMTLSRYACQDYTRVNFSTEYDWPTRIFYLDRCFLAQRCPLAGGKDLVLINTHCSAYDEEGSMVATQIKEISDFAEAEYQKGNYVVIGGDWNQCPPNYEPIDPNGGYNEFILQNDQLPEGFEWIADPTIPTNRKTSEVYKKGETYTSVIDHFAISPNLQVEEIAVQDLNFQFSDHQPVKLKVRLR